MFAARAWLHSHGRNASRNPQVAPGKAINLGARGLAAPEATSEEASKDEAEGLKFSAKVGVASDYVYRGTTLSDRKPAVGATVEATFAGFYAWTSAASVRLPTQPDAELAFGAGIRRTIGNADFDLGATYFAYPGDMRGAASIDYWEAAFRSEVKLTESLRWAGGFAYSPNISNTGAWSGYAASGLVTSCPPACCPPISACRSRQPPATPGSATSPTRSAAFRCPPISNWHAGVTITYKSLNLDLRYYDTNLSKENCFVFTGDAGAGPGGHRDPITNPAGLMSNWCSAAFVAKAWIALN